MRPLDRIWIWYLVTMLLVTAAFGWGPAPSHHRPGLYAAILGGLLAIVLALQRRPDDVVARGVFCVIGLPVVFSSLGLVLPHLHPEPYEFMLIAADRALFGGDPTVAMASWLAPWSTELLYWCYASFYFLPVVTLLWIARRRGQQAFERSLALVVFSFLWSYLFYVLLPARGPQLYFPRGGEPQGLWLAASLDRWLIAAEANKWDLFPSGHTWVTLVTLVIAWRHVRVCFAILLPIGVGLVAATMLLNLHYVIDVIAGTVMAAITIPVGGLLTSPGPGRPAPAEAHTT